MKAASCKTTLMLIGASKVTHGAICTHEATIPRMAGFWGQNSNLVHSLQRLNNIDSGGRTSGKVNVQLSAN